MSVLPNPVASADGPSLRMMVVVARSMLTDRSESSVCSRVLTTSMGTVNPWLKEAAMPPAMKYLYESSEIACALFANRMLASTASCNAEIGGKDAGLVPRRVAKIRELVRKIDDNLPLCNRGVLAL